MVPVLTPDEMGQLDRASPEPLEVLVSRAGGAVAREALRMMGGGYGRRVTVVAGKGNNGADGREAARRLAHRGVMITLIEAADAPRRLPDCDLVIDAAYGTGFRGEYIAPLVSGWPMTDEPLPAAAGSRARSVTVSSRQKITSPVPPPAAAGRRTRSVVAPDSGRVPVLAVDIPSGVDGLTGEAGPSAVRADGTITFAALKPGLLLGAGPRLSGSTSVADIGLDAREAARTWLVEGSDVTGWLPARSADAHKWQSAVWVAAGSPGMTGAAQLCAAAVLRAGAGTVRLGVPGSPARSLPSAPEVVGRNLPAEGWETELVPDLGRARVLVIGPGLGRTPSVSAAVRRAICLAPDIAAVIDADALWALGEVEEAVSILAHRRAATVLTPHEGEFIRLTGAPVPADRVGAVRDLAQRLKVTILLKGPATLVADPEGTVLITNTGDPRLATAGTGDVLAGIAGAFLATGIEASRAAAAAAYVHGTAARLGWERGLVAGDLLELIPRALASLP